jgi:hypothetical protein
MLPGVSPISDPSQCVKSCSKKNNQKKLEEKSTGVNK